MAASPTGLLDNHLIEDTHHPNLKGQLVLAGAVLRELRGRRTFITLAPKKLIRTRRASEGSASEPSLARRVSMC